MIICAQCKVSIEDPRAHPIRYQNENSQGVQDFCAKCINEIPHICLMCDRIQTDVDEDFFILNYPLPPGLIRSHSDGKSYNPLQAVIRRLFFCSVDCAQKVRYQIYGQTQNPKFQNSNLPNQNRLLMLISNLDQALPIWREQEIIRRVEREMPFVFPNYPPQPGICIQCRQPKFSCKCRCAQCHHLKSECECGF